MDAPNALPSLPPAVGVLGHPVHPVDLEAASRWVLAAAASDRAHLVVTLNPEIIVRARRDEALRRALDHADLTVADGVGVVWAARRQGHVLPGRVPGVDLACTVLERAGPGVRVALLGGRPGVAERAAAAARERWGSDVVFVRDGYFDHEREGRGVAEAVAAAGAQLLLAGLGERQETVLEAHRGAWGAGVLIGVGGTLDVIAGVATRTPAWTRRLGLEWAWRVGLDPARWHRLPRLARFVALALRAPRPASAPRVPPGSPSPSRRRASRPDNDR
jgi:N-acetylglucosaminyldiphosphoundecaprenol N-acetyl-beta-D-mannosaminyltransferase